LVYRAPGHVLLKIAELEIQLVYPAPGHVIEELVYALCYQSNEEIEKTEVGFYHKYGYI